VDECFFSRGVDLRLSSLRELALVVRRGDECAGDATGRAEASNGDNSEGDDTPDEDTGGGVATANGSLTRPDHGAGTIGWGAFEEVGGNGAAGGSSRLEGSMTQKKTGALGVPQRSLYESRI
jgi:hypothetical protein